MSAIAAAGVIGVVTGTTAAIGILGARWVFKLPHLSINTAGITATATFISTVAAVGFKSYFPDDINNDNFRPVDGAFWGIFIIGGAVLTAYGNKRLVNQNISVFASAATSVASQVVGISIFTGIQNSL